MKIAVQKTIVKQERVNLRKLAFLNCGSIDIESVRLKIYYNEQEIGYGQLNIVKQYAHVTITLGEDLMSWEDARELEQYLVKNIERGRIGCYASAPIN